MTKKFLTCAFLVAAVTAPAAAQSTDESRLTVHGFLTQGFATSNDMPVAGIPTTGTTDYRSLAIQGRYAFDESSSLVVQLSHRRVGTSKLGDLEAPVDLDWAFYRHRVGPVVLRAGRIPVPIGFYNEIRDVGTVLPLFRAPRVTYPEGAETVDGVAAAATVRLGAWELESQAFAGGIDFKSVAQTPEGPSAYTARSNRSAGAGLMLSTPVEGLRAGVTALTWTDDASDDRVITIYFGSIELDRDRWMVRSERMHVATPQANIDAGYVQGRFKVTSKLHAVAQYELSKLHLHQPMDLRYTQSDDRALGVSYAATPNLALKLEGHRVKGYDFDAFVNPFGPAARTNYGIASISVSF